ncbi:hypothetical protein SCA6_017937 [Theobroma cacao]
MELSLSGNTLRNFGPSITCLARVGNELVIQLLLLSEKGKGNAKHFHLLLFVRFSRQPNRILYLLAISYCNGSTWQYLQLALHTLNSSRSAYQSITFKPNFFDVYGISGTQVQCSVLLKDTYCNFASIDHLTVKLADLDASKVQWALECYSGMKNACWITCNVEADRQHLSLDWRRFPSNLVVRPHGLNRLLANFQSSLQEITIIATELMSLPSDAASEIGGKAVELRSYIDPTKDNDSSLHTQLRIDHMEEFVQYTHTGDPVDVTFNVKELKAFLTFCEGCEVDIHLFFDVAGDYMKAIPLNLCKQLQLCMTRQCMRQGLKNSKRGSAAKSGSGVEERQVQKLQNLNASEQRDIQRISMMQITKAAPIRETVPTGPNFFTVYSSHRQVERDHVAGVQDRNQINGLGLSQRHPSNWVDADEDDDDGDENELRVQSTPPYYEEQQ